MKQPTMKALLLAGGTYEANNVPDLPIVGNDISLMRAALEASGYIVNVAGLDSDTRLTRTNLIWKIRQFAKAASENDTIIIYYTGHGFHVDGTDYIVPADARFDDPEMISEYLVALNFPALFDQCAAKTILIAIDACRDGASLALSPDMKSASLLRWGEGKIASSKSKYVTYIYSCTAGEFSRYVDGPGGFSIFTKALAEVLGPSHPAATLPQIEQALQEAVDKVSTANKKPKQTVRIRAERNADPGRDGPIICLKPDYPVQGFGASSWRDAALNSLLWTLAPPCADDLAQAFRTRVGAIAATAQELSQRAHLDSANMPWLDSSYSLRFLSRVEFLCREIRGEFKPTCAEVALMLVSIFTHEAIRSAALLSVASERIYDAEPSSAGGSPGSEMRSAFNTALAKQDAVFATLTSEGESTNPQQVRTATAWVAQKWISQTREFWHDGSGSFIQAAYWSRILPREDGPANAILDQARLLYIVERLTEIEPFTHNHAYGNLEPLRTHLASTRLEQDVHEILILHILVLAGRLAIDVASLSDVILENILVADSVTPSELSSTLANTEWLPRGRDRVLKARCTHPAIDVALTRHVELANEVLQRIHQKSVQREDWLELAANLPTNLLPADIVSSENTGPQSYLTPHIRLRLSDRKVRDLLMGERLYGNKALAIREMYQNALDACRYRNARADALRRKGATLSDWRGSITFRQGTDSDGRTYIECEDNGIGMSHAILNECFACAGQRFADLTEFVDEQREWRSLEPPIVMVPNSQFGIGVFSYFMLGAEVRITTRRFGQDGALGEGLEATVDSRSGLFRVRPYTGRDCSGTTVRVYLLPNDSIESISCLSLLSQQIFVADFDTNIEEGQRSVSWKAGKLMRYGRNYRSIVAQRRRRSRPGFRISRGRSLFDYAYPDLSEAAEDSDYVLQSTHPNLWWIENEDGLLLADGIRTDRSLSYAVVNLTGPQRPLLSIDRLSLQRWDADYVQRLLQENIESLAQAPWLSVEWLWAFSGSHPKLADRLVDRLSALGRRLPLAQTVGREATRSVVTYDLTHVGCIPQDHHVLRAMDLGEANVDGMPARLLAYRCELWRRASGNHNSASEDEPALVSLSKVSTVDWQSVHRICLSENRNGQAPWLKGKVSHWHIFRTAAVTGRSPAAIAAILHDYALLLSLDLSDIDFDALPADVLDPIEARLIGARSKILTFRNFDILYASHRTQATVSEVARRVAALERFDLCGSNFSPDLLAWDHIIDKGEFLLLDAKRNWEGQPGEEDVIALAAAQNEDVGTIVARLERLAPFVPELLPALRHPIGELIPKPGDPLLLSRRLNGRAPWLTGDVAPGHVLRAAVHFGLPIAAVVERLESLAGPLDLKLPNVDWGALDFDPASPFDGRILSLHLDGSAPWLSGTVSAAHILAAAVLMDVPPEEAFDRLGRLAEVLGFHFTVERNALVGLTPDDDQVKLLSLNMNGKHPWLAGAISPRQVAERADVFSLHAAEILEIFASYANLLELDLTAALDVDYDKVPPLDTDVLSLFSKHDAWVPRFTILHAVRAAHDLEEPLVTILDQAKAYREMIDYDIPEDIEGRIPADFPNDVDTDFLEERCDSSSTRRKGRFVSSRPVTTAEILSIAADNRIPARRVLDRAEAAAAFGALRLADDISDELPEDLLSNDELAVLSRDADQEPPWLTGKVVPMQIIFASYKTGLTLRRVVETMERYRGFLSLSLPQALDRMRVDEVAEKLDCVLGSVDLDGSGPWITGEISDVHLEAFARLIGLTMEAARQRRARLQKFGHGA